MADNVVSGETQPDNGQTVKSKDTSCELRLRRALRSRWVSVSVSIERIFLAIHDVLLNPDIEWQCLSTGAFGTWHWLQTLQNASNERRILDFKNQPNEEPGSNE